MRCLIKGSCVLCAMTKLCSFCLMALMFLWSSGVDAHGQAMVPQEPITGNGGDDSGRVYLSVVVAGRHDNLRGTPGDGTVLNPDEPHCVPH